VSSQQDGKSLQTALQQEATSQPPPSCAAQQSPGAGQGPAQVSPQIAWASSAHALDHTASQQDGVLVQTKSQQVKSSQAPPECDSQQLP